MLSKVLTFGYDVIRVSINSLVSDRVYYSVTIIIIMMYTMISTINHDHDDLYN